MESILYIGGMFLVFMLYCFRRKIFKNWKTITPVGVELKVSLWIVLFFVTLIFAIYIKEQFQ